MKTAYLQPTRGRLIVSVTHRTDNTNVLEASSTFVQVHRETLCDKRSNETPATYAIKHRLIRDGNFRKIFGSLGKGRRRWTKSQVTRVCRDHGHRFLTKGRRTFFELKGGLVLEVTVRKDGQFDAREYKFSGGGTWQVMLSQFMVLS